MSRPTPAATLFPYTTLFRSDGSFIALLPVTPACNRDRTNSASRGGGTAIELFLASCAEIENFWRRIVDGDRKSTRLNSSHANISYAAFCAQKNTNAPNASKG